MTEVEKMRSSQLADMSAPELQVRFEHAKKLLAIMRGLSTYDDGYRELLEELVPGIPETSVICPPFHCDHGDGIKLGHLYFSGRRVYHNRCPYASRSLRTDLYTASSDELSGASRFERVCLSGYDRRGLLDWRRCCHLSRCDDWQPLCDRSGKRRDERYSRRQCCSRESGAPYP